MMKFLSLEIREDVKVALQKYSKEQGMLIKKIVELSIIDYLRKNGVKI